MERKKPQPARKYTDAQKMTIIGELLAGETAEAVAARYQMPTGTCHGWRYDAHRNAGEGGRIARLIRDKQFIDISRPGVKELVVRLVTNELQRLRRGDENETRQHLAVIFFELFITGDDMLFLTQGQKKTLREMLKACVMKLSDDDEVTVGRLSRLAFQLGA